MNKFCLKHQNVKKVKRISIHTKISFTKDIEQTVPSKVPIVYQFYVSLCA